MMTPAFRWRSAREQIPRLHMVGLGSSTDWLSTDRPVDTREQRGFLEFVPTIPVGWARVWSVGA